MKTLSALIKEYKETNDDSLKDTIWDFILSDENNDLFKDIFVYRDDCDWVEYEETTKLKRLCPKHFVATQVLKTIGDRYICYCYRINLGDYSKQVIDVLRNNNIKLERLSPDDEFFTAAAVLTSIPPESAVKVCVANGADELNNWYITIDKMLGSAIGATGKELSSNEEN